MAVAVFEAGVDAESVVLLAVEDRRVLAAVERQALEPVGQGRVVGLLGARGEDLPLDLERRRQARAAVDPAQRAGAAVVDAAVGGEHADARSVAEGLLDAQDVRGAASADGERAARPRRAG